jgi:5-oxoprolinase (ATP-hydrolysing) subunit A
MILDLNADVGEGFATDVDLMPLLTSANVCCGFHAGDAETTRATLELAVAHRVTIGAHPGYPDREHFGRREQNLSDRQIATMVFHQLGAILGVARLARAEVKYLKPHGALYNQACRELTIARPVVAAAFLYGLSIVGLPGSQIEVAAAAVGVPFIAEGFADRRYRPDGSLVPRHEAHCHIDSAEEAVAQVEQLVGSGRVRTICVHGDNPAAVGMIDAIRSKLHANGHTIRALNF